MTFVIKSTKEKQQIFCIFVAIPSLIGQTATEGSHFRCPWPGTQRRSLASDSKVARDRRAGHAKYEWTDTLVALLIGRPMDRNRNCGAVVTQECGTRKWGYVFALGRVRVHMCRDVGDYMRTPRQTDPFRGPGHQETGDPVSYTHLTLPTICSV